MFKEAGGGEKREKIINLGFVVDKKDFMEGVLSMISRI